MAGPIRRRRRRLYRPLTARERLASAFGIIAIVTIAGAIGFMAIEDLSLLDALYLTVHTVSTVGAYDPLPAGPGRAFSLLLIMAGVTAVGYALFSINMWLLEGAVLQMMGEHRIGRQLRGLKDHVILCGAGRIGRLVADDLNQAEAEFVVIEHNGSRVKDLLEKGILAIEGNAADEEILQQAGIERANTLITVVHSDADNLYITMTARSLNADLTIVARAEDSQTVTKLKRVGANRVVAPYHLGALRIANAVLRPAITDIIEMTMPHGGDVLGLQIAEVQVAARSRLAGRALKETGLRQELGIMAIAIRSADGRTQVNPEPDHAVEAGSTLVAIGTQEQLERLSTWAAS